MGMIRKGMLMLLSAALLLLSVSACSEYKGQEIIDSNKKNTSDKKIILKFTCDLGGTGTNAGVLKEILDDFQKANPGIVVNNESMSGESFLKKLVVDFASGYDPDVFGLEPGSDMWALIWAGKVAPLDEELEAEPAWKESFEENEFWEYTRSVDSRVYGLPFERIFDGLFYNVDLFAAHRIKVPATYEELKRAVAAFKARGFIPIAYNSAVENSYLYQDIVAMLGGKDETERPFMLEQTNCYTKGMEYMKDLYDSGAFPVEVFTTDSSIPDKLFLSGKAAMIVQSSRFIEKCDPKNVKLTTFPRFKEGKAASIALVCGLGGATFCMSNAATKVEEKKKASVKLLQALTSHLSVRMFEQKGILLSMEKDNPGPFSNELSKEAHALIRSAGEYIEPPDHKMNREMWNKYIVKQLPSVMMGKKKPLDVWDDAVTKTTGSRWNR